MMRPNSLAEIGAVFEPSESPALPL